MSLPKPLHDGDQPGEREAARLLDDDEVGRLEQEGRDLKAKEATQRS